MCLERSERNGHNYVENPTYYFKVFRPTTSYIGEDIFNDPEFSALFWGHLSSNTVPNSIKYLTDDYVFDIVAWHDKSGKVSYAGINFIPISSFFPSRISGGFDYSPSITVDSSVLPFPHYDATRTLVAGKEYLYLPSPVFVVDHWERCYFGLKRESDGSFLYKNMQPKSIPYSHNDYTFDPDYHSSLPPDEVRQSYLCNYDFVVTASNAGDTKSFRKIGSTRFFPNDLGTVSPVDPPAEEEHFSKITLPRDGFKQSKLNAVSMWVNYKVPYDGDMKKVDIKIGGYRADRPIDTISHDVNVSGDGKTLEGFLRVSGAVPWNIETKLIAQITDYTGKVYSDNVTVTCFDDFIDADGDGNDDRTNEDEWGGNPDYGNPTNPPGGGIGGSLPDMEEVLNLVSGWTTGFIGFIAGFFTFLPPEITIILTLSIVVLFALRILGR